VYVVHICSKTDAYKVSRNGKKYKRLEIKRKVQCPLCSHKDVWISGHLRKKHELTDNNIQILLSQDPTYRRRGAANPKPRRQCPYCESKVVSLSNHLRWHHNTTATALRNSSCTVPAANATPAGTVITAPSAGYSSHDPAAAHLLSSLLKNATKTTSAAATESTSRDPAAAHLLSTLLKNTAKAATESTSRQGQPVCQLMSALLKNTAGTTALAVTASSSKQDHPDTIIKSEDKDDEDDEDEINVPPSPSSSEQDMFVDSSEDEHENLHESAVFDNDSEFTVTTSLPAEMLEVCESFEKYLGSMDGGHMASPDIYSLAIKQILLAVGSNINCLTKYNVRTLYVEPLLKDGNEKKNFSNNRQK